MILKYGYPFDDIKKVTEQGFSKRKSVILKTSRYWLEHLIGDLSYSANQQSASDLISAELDALCTRLEHKCCEKHRLILREKISEPNG